MRNLAELLAADRDVIGTWSQIAAADLIDIIGAAGYDFTIVDCEHAAFGLETAEQLLRACKASDLVPLLRVPANDRSWIGRALDAGASGVIVPGIGSVDDAVRAVAATRFAPEGTRGACPCVRSGDHFVREWRPYVQAQQAEHGVILLVETREGVDAIEGICAVPGARALLVGPFDLAVSMGHQGDHAHPEVTSAIERMLRAAEECGLPVLMPVFAPVPAEARRQVDVWRSRGIRRFVVGTDKILVSDHLSRYRASLLHDPT